MLEDEANFAGELRASIDERTGDREQSRRVPVVAAGMHDTVRARRKLDAALLGDRQGVHVSAKGQRPPGTVAMQPRHHTRRRRTFELEAPERRKRLVHEPRRLVLLKGQLRIRVEVPSPGDRFPGQRPRFHLRSVSHARRALNRDRSAYMPSRAAIPQLEHRIDDVAQRALILAPINPAAASRR